jgi:hypothetical protein
MAYVVSTISRDATDRIVTERVGEYQRKDKAMAAAKKAAHTRRDCQTYGPSSLAYVGDEITAVVAW